MAARPTVHNLWKRHRKQRQSDPESREISEVLTITSVKPIVTKYHQKFPSGSSHKNECSSSNRTQTQACPGHVNDSLAILQNKNIPQDSNETDSKNPRNSTHAKSRVVNSFSSRKITAQPCSVFKQDRPNASKTTPSTGSSVNSVNNPVLNTGQRPTTLSCAGFKVLALHRLARQGQKLVKRNEASAVVSRISTTETVSSMTIRNVPLSNAANTKPTATVRTMTIDSHRPAEMQDQTEISVQGSSAVCITNQQTSSARHGGVANNPVHTTSSGKEAGHKSASKSCLSFKNSSDCMDARRYCVNLTSLMHSQPETHNPRTGHDVNITGDSTNSLQKLEKHSLHKCLPCIREAPSQLPDSDCTSDLADINKLLTVKTDKEADLEAMEKAPEDHVAVTKTHGSATPTGSQQATRGNSLNIRGGVSACALGIPNQSEKVSTTGAEVKTIPANQENSKSIVTPKNSVKVSENTADTQNITEHFLKEKNVSGSAVDTTTIQIKTDDNTDNSGNVMVCTVKTCQPDSSSNFTENVCTKCIPISVATSPQFSTNCSVSKHGDANRMQKKHGTVYSSDSKTNSRSFTNKEDITTVLAHVPDSAGNATKKENIKVLGNADDIQTECSTTYSSHSKTNSRSFSNKGHISTVLTHVPDSPETAVKSENVKVRTHSVEPSSENVNVELTEPQVTPNKTTVSSTERDTFTHVRGTANHVCVDYSKKDDDQKRDTRIRASLENKSTNKQQSVKKRNICKNITGFEDAAQKEPDFNEIPDVLLDSSSHVVERGCKSKDQYNPEHSSEKPVNIKHESTKPDDLNETVSNTVEIKDSSAKAKGLDGVGDKGHEKERGFDVNEKPEQPDVNSSTKDSEDTETKERLSGCSSAGPRAVKTFDCDHPAFAETVADMKELECKVTPCEGPSSHQGISLRGKENAGAASRPVALKFPNEEMKSENARMICSSSDCFQNSRAEVSTAGTENRNESHQQNKTSVQKTQTSTSEHQQHTGPERVTTTTTVKKDSPKSKHAQPKTKPDRSQILVSKQTDSVYSQKLPRTRGKNQTASKHKEDSQENAAAAWPRVQSAQPQVFRVAARGTNKVDHPRSKSVMDMAGDKEPASRCHCQRRLPGSDRVSCQCSQALEESSDAGGPRTDLDRQVKWFRMLWDQCCSQNTLDKALNVLKQMPREHRQLLVREVDSQNTCSMLMTSCVAGHLQMVDFLLDECSVDMDRREQYHDTRSPFGPSVHDKVTALWVAAVEGQLDIVQTLLRHGADIHAKSANGSSAVRSACYRLQVEVVEVLLKAGADVHSPNVVGVTCLMNGCNSPELCHLLLRHGARPKDRDVSGNTALHYAAAVGQLDSLRLLQQFGGNVMERNGAGNTVLRCAALRGWLHVVESLAQGCGSLGMVEIIEAYELAGSALVDLDSEEEGEGGVQCYQAGVLAWQKALQLRHISGLPKSRLRQEKIAPFQFRLEFSSQAELERIAADRSEGRIHALLVKERICGPQTEELIEAVMSRGEMCLEAGLYRSCIDLWIHAFRLLLDPSGPLGTATNYSPRRLLKLFLDLSEHGGTDAEEQGILQPSDTLAVLQLLVQFLNHTLKPRNSTSSVLNEASNSRVQHEPSVDAELGTYLLHLQMSLHLIRIISTFQELLPGDLQRFHQMVYSLVKADHRSGSGDSLLHLCFRLSELDPGREESRLPTVQLLEILLQCGAEVDAVNHLGETPLFYIFTRRRPPPGRGQGSSGGAGDFFSWADKESWAQVLLRRQAHADRRTPGGRGVLRSLKRLDGFCLLSHVSLQCLAARVVRDCRLPYRDPELLPAHLISFVDIH